MSDEQNRHGQLGEALSLLAHDLKNPLAAVLTNLAYVGSALQEERSVSEDVREAMTDARLACESLQRFVHNLELFGRDAAGRASMPPLETAPLDLRSVVDDVLERQRESATGRRLRFEIVDGAGGPAGSEGKARIYALADRELVVRALDNLVADSVQCAPARSVIELLVRRLGAHEVAIVVRDDGAIVPEELRDLIPTANGQTLSKGRPEARYGRGLALWAASIAARLAGGRLDLGAVAGKSALTVVVPAHQDES